MIPLFQFTREKTMGVHTEWLLLDDGSRLEVLTDAYILPGSCVTVAQVNGQSVDYIDIYRTSLFRPLKYHRLSTQSTLNFTAFPARPSRDDFEGITLLGAAVVSILLISRQFKNYLRIRKKLRYRPIN